MLRPFLRLPPQKRETLSSTGRKGVCGKPGKGVLHEDDPHFSELFEALKNASAWRKDFFATLKEGRSVCSGLLCLLVGKHTYQLSPNCRLQPSPQTIMASHASVLS